jgi:hypothetical protein
MSPRIRHERHHRPTRALVDKINQVKDRAAETRIGVVTQASPLKIKLGGSTTEITSPTSLVSGLAVDDVVVVLVSGGDIIVLGSKDSQAVTGGFIGARLNRNGNQNIETGSSGENATFPSGSQDFISDSALHSTVTNNDQLRLGDVALGVWHVAANVSFSGSSVGIRRIAIEKNDSSANYVAFQMVVPDDASAMYLSCSGLVRATTSTDYVNVWLMQNSGSTRTADIYFTCHYLGDYT